MNLKLLLTMSPCLLLALSANATQTSFQTQDNVNTLQLSYTWKDSFGNERDLVFELEKDKIAEQHRHTRAYRQEIALRHVYMEMQREARKVNPREARIRFKKLSKEIQISVQSNNSDIAQRWRNEMIKKQEEAFTSYLRANYYERYFGPFGEVGVKPDHVRYVGDSVFTVLPAAQAIYEQLEEDSTSRAYVNLLLSWVQSIPYNTLEDRLVSNGSGYLPPADVLTENQGDCDSKAVLTAALLRSLLPQLSMAIIYLPNHALLAANLPAFEEEVQITIEGINHVLLEPTGPAIVGIGKISEEMERYIGNSMYTYQIVP